MVFVRKKVPLIIKFCYWHVLLSCDACLTFSINSCPNSVIISGKFAPNSSSLGGMKSCVWDPLDDTNANYESYVQHTHTHTDMRCLME